MAAKASGGGRGLFERLWERFGEVAKRMRIVGDGDVRKALSEQKARKGRSEPHKKIGRLLVESGKMKGSEVGKVLAEQKKSAGKTKKEAAAPKKKAARKPKKAAKKKPKKKIGTKKAKKRAKAKG
jgi:hypothetical protein